MIHAKCLAQPLAGREDPVRGKFLNIGCWYLCKFLCVELLLFNLLRTSCKWRVCLCAKLPQSYLTLFNPMDYSLPGSSVLWFPRQEYWSGLSCSPPGDLPNPGIEPASLTSPALIGGFFAASVTSAAAAKSLQSCPILCDPIDGSPPGSLFPRIPQARILEWFAISFSNVWKWSHSVMSDS